MLVSHSDDKVFRLIYEYEEQADYDGALEILSKIDKISMLTDFEKEIKVPFLETFLNLKKDIENKDTSKEKIEKEFEKLQDLAKKDKENKLELEIPGVFSENMLVKTYFKESNLNEIKEIAKNLVQKKKKITTVKNKRIGARIKETEEKEDLRAIERINFIENNFKVSRVLVGTRLFDGRICFEFEGTDIVLVESIYIINAKNEKVDDASKTSYVFPKWADFDLDSLHRKIFKDKDKKQNLIKTLNHKVNYYSSLKLLIEFEIEKLNKNNVEEPKNTIQDFKVEENENTKESNLDNSILEDSLQMLNENPNKVTFNFEDETIPEIEENTENHDYEQNSSEFMAENPQKEDNSVEYYLSGEDKTKFESKKVKVNFENAEDIENEEKQIENINKENEPSKYILYAKKIINEPEPLKENGNFRITPEEEEITKMFNLPEDILNLYGKINLPNVNVSENNEQKQIEELKAKLRNKIQIFEQNKAKIEKNKQEIDEKEQKIKNLIINKIEENSNTLKALEKRLANT